ncbi:hypothetical protein TNCV_1147371 [Trichonephila clavipes]|nr:hypothetical protein TNCV_1147371 [Trichonephila clavipes]
MISAEWTACPLDLNNIEHVWDALVRYLAARSYSPENTRPLKQILLEEWQLLPQELLDNLVLSRNRRCHSAIVGHL